uniref:Uncharacterized protein n=1 Tax=Arundo donax TaxID=35708 RepID=A0A0A9CCG8_ARUDO
MDPGENNICKQREINCKRRDSREEGGLMRETQVNIIQKSSLIYDGQLSCRFEKKIIQKD